MFQLSHEHVGKGGAHLVAFSCATYLVVDVWERKVIPGKDKLGVGNLKVSGWEGILWSLRQEIFK